MSLSDYLKCPGPDRSLNAVPEMVGCPQCGNSVEIWSDEHKRRCPVCKTIVSANHIEILVQQALDLGASGAKGIKTVNIVTDEALARLCRSGQPPCENYGLSRSCPPHAGSLETFKALQDKSADAVVVRLDVPASSMFSSERREIMQLLHYIVAGVEIKAKALGFKASQALAGGSCKKIFCSEYVDCSGLADSTKCRNPEQARPSMSGFGIDVVRMMKTAGWDLKPTEKDEKSMDSETGQALGWVAGLIVLC